MTSASTPVTVRRVQRGVGRLRAAEVYVQSLADRLTLLAHQDAGRGERLAQQLAEVERACGAIAQAARPLLDAVDPHLADRTDEAARLAQRLGEHACLPARRTAPGHRAA